MTDAPVARRGPDVERGPVFVKDREYTREQIHDALGGSRVSCLPTVGGTVVAACLLKELSPQAPSVVLCGQGPRTGVVSGSFAAHRGALPVFVKIAANRWQYRGRFTVARSLVSGPAFRRHVAGSGRTLASVSVVVLLDPVHEP